MASMSIRAVTFDFWNTLVREHDGARDRRVAALVLALAEIDQPRSPEQVEAVVDGLRTWFDARWLDNLVVDPEVGAARLVTALELEPGPRVVDAVAGVFHAGGDPALLTVAPGIDTALAGLQAAGVRIGIICDTGFAPGATLRRYLEHHGLLRYFDHWSFSDEVGVFKPDPAIFAHAASGLGVDAPSAFAHVGDLRRTDVGGATAAGWTAVRYRGLNDDVDASSPDAAIVVDHHGELLAALGLA